MTVSVKEHLINSPLIY